MSLPIFVTARLPPFLTEIYIWFIPLSFPAGGETAIRSFYSAESNENARHQRQTRKQPRAFQRNVLYTFTPSLQ